MDQKTSNDILFIFVILLILLSTLLFFLKNDEKVYEVNKNIIKNSEVKWDSKTRIVEVKIEKESELSPIWPEVFKLVFYFNNQIATFFINENESGIISINLSNYSGDILIVKAFSVYKGAESEASINLQIIKIGDNEESGSLDSRDSVSGITGRATGGGGGGSGGGSSNPPANNPPIVTCTNDIGCSSAGNFCSINGPYNCTQKLDGCFDRVNKSKCEDGKTCLNGDCTNEISDCGAIINSNGSYGLISNLTSDSKYVCIEVWADNVELNCDGHTISNLSSAGIYLAGENITVRNCRFSSPRIGVQGVCAEGSNNSKIYNSVFQNIYRGIYLTKSKNTEISGNVFSNILSIESTNSCENLEIKNNSFNDFSETKSAIWINSTNNLLEANSITGYKNAISLLEGSRNVTIKNNLILNSMFGINSGASNILIEGNELNFTTVAISLQNTESGVDNTTVINNRIYYANIGMNFVKTKQGIRIIGNTLFSGITGFYISDTEGISFSNNSITNFSSRGMSISYSKNLEIKDNLVLNNTGDGVYSFSSSNVSFRNNRFCDNIFNDVYCGIDISPIFEGNSCGSGYICGGECVIC